MTIGHRHSNGAVQNHSCLTKLNNTEAWVQQSVLQFCCWNLERLFEKQILVDKRQYSELRCDSLWPRLYTWRLAIFNAESNQTACYYFLARDSICLARYMLSPFRQTIRLSFYLWHEWISQKRLNLGLCNFHTSSFCGISFIQKL